MAHYEEHSVLLETRKGKDVGQPPVDLRIGHTMKTGVKDNMIVQGDFIHSYPYSANGSRLISQRNTVHDWHWLSHPEWDHYVVSEPSYQPYWLGRFAPISWPNMDTEITEAKTKCLNELVIRSQQLGASLAESRQTWRMFVSNARILTRALYAAKRGVWGQIPSILGMSKRDVLSGKFPANRWLEYQYGWKPLIQDIHEGQQKIHDEFTKGTILRVSRTVNRIGDHPDFQDGDGTVSIRSKHGIKCTIVARIDVPGLAEINSWGLINPLSIAWELVPFSFVVDWFIPIGNTLSAMTAGLGLTFIEGYFSERHRSTVTWRGFDRRQGSDYVVDRKGGFIEMENWSFSRHPLAAMPTPGLYLGDPFMTKKGDLKIQRILNGIALLR